MANGHTETENSDKNKNSANRFPIHIYYPGLVWWLALSLIKDKIDINQKDCNRRQQGERNTIPTIFASIMKNCTIDDPWSVKMWHKSSKYYNIAAG